jgi:transcription elongation factor GreA
MADNRMITARASRPSEVPLLSTAAMPPPLATGVQLSPADYAELMRELDELRSRHRGELAQRLRDARDFGSPGDADDRLAAFEDAAVDKARIAQLEQLARCASVVAVSDDADGAAGLGSTIRVADEAGETMEFALVGRRAADSPPREVSLASPVGKALVGVRAGDFARVALPSGRVRLLRVLDVTSEPHVAQNSRSGSAAKAA